MRLLYALWGLLAGVLINHAADALLNQRPLYERPSCGFCAQKWPPRAWSGLSGYLFARGHCPHCSAPIPLRRVIVELTTALLFAFLWDYYGPSIQLGLVSLYSTVLILVVVTDMEKRMIYNAVMLPAIALAAIGGFFNDDFTPTRAWLGGLTGFAVIFAVYLLAGLFAWLMSRRGRPLSEVAFGFGDVKLAIFIGLITGLPGVVFALVLGIFLAGVVAGLYLLVSLATRRYRPFMAFFPYGPFLVIGGFIVMVYGPQIINWYIVH